MKRVVTWLKTKLGICVSKGCNKKGDYIVSLAIINTKRFLCKKYFKEFKKITNEEGIGDSCYGLQKKISRRNKDIK